VKVTFVAQQTGAIAIANKSAVRGRVVIAASYLSEAMFCHHEIIMIHVAANLFALSA
jgi:hypothetical protein